MITADRITQISHTAAGVVEYLARDLPSDTNLFHRVELAVRNVLEGRPHVEPQATRECQECGVAIAADWDGRVCPSCREWLDETVTSGRHVQLTRFDLETVR